MEELFMACGIGDYPTHDVRHYDTPVVVKLADQHPCDPPIGEVVDVQYNEFMNAYELIIAPINE
jgi:hypothetical protein